MVWSQFRVWDMSRGLSLRSAALQSFNSSASLPLLLSVSLYLSLYSAPGWFGRVTWAVSCTQAGPEFLTACCLRGDYSDTESEREFDKERCKSTAKTKAVRERNSKLDRVNEFTLTAEYTFWIPWQHMVHLAPWWTIQCHASLLLEITTVACYRARHQSNWFLCVFFVRSNAFMPVCVCTRS